MSELNKNQKSIIYIILTLIVLVIIYYIWIITHEDEETIVQEYNEIENNEYAISNVTNEIIVHVAGAVENEGIQKLPENSRIADQTTPNMIQRISGIFERKPLISKEI